MSLQNVQNYINDEKFIKYNDKTKRAFDMVKKPTKQQQEEYSFTTKDWEEYMSNTDGFYTKIYKAYMLKEEEYKSLKQRQEEAKESGEKIPLTQEEMIKQFLEKNKVKTLDPEEKQKEVYEGQNRRFLRQSSEKKAEQKLIQKEVKGIYDGLKMMYPDGSRIVEFEQIDGLAGNVRGSKSKAGLKALYRRTITEPSQNVQTGSRKLWGNSIKKNIENEKLVPIDQEKINQYIKTKQESKEKPKGPKI